MKKAAKDLIKAVQLAHNKGVPNQLICEVFHITEEDLSFYLFQTVEEEKVLENSNTFYNLR